MRKKSISLVEMHLAPAQVAKHPLLLAAAPRRLLTKHLLQSSSGPGRELEFGRQQSGNSKKIRPIWRGRLQGWNGNWQRVIVSSNRHRGPAKSAERNPFFTVWHVGDDGATSPLNSETRICDKCYSKLDFKPDRHCDECWKQIPPRTVYWQGGGLTWCEECKAEAEGILRC